MNVRPGFSAQTVADGQKKPASFAQHYSAPASFSVSDTVGRRTADVDADASDTPQAEPVVHTSDLSASVPPLGMPYQERAAHMPDSKADLLAQTQALSGGSRPTGVQAGLRLTGSEYRLQQHQLSFGSQDTAALLKSNNTANVTPSDQLNKLFLSRHDAPLAGTATIATSADPAASAVQHASAASPNSIAATDKPAWANIQVDTSQGKWGEQMMQILQDRVSMQASQKMQEARIRLDPPELGKLDLLVKVDGDRLHVQINANHAQVREALVQVSERLRHELQLQQFVHVDVNVGTDTPQDSSQPFYQDEDDTYQITSATPTDSEDNTRPHSSDYWLSTSA
ncbi:flagellar hook-length control protein FliK [Vibrio albus]|uniref:Flagellar hook-length control protein FliK n=2 Tax=Vibrio albus TaxID=2200953 RepID=A0A2U3B8R3_9VIBR|nr:flagellar hook-length control protein FliK [Vibrio albus]